MGCSHSSVRGVSSGDSTGFLRQADATKDAGDIRSDGGTDGRRVGGLSDRRMVGLSALVLAGTGVVDMLVSVSFAGDMEEDVAIRQCSDADAASFVANILAGVIALGMIKEKNKA